MCFCFQSLPLSIDCLNDHRHANVSTIHRTNIRKPFEHSRSVHTIVLQLYVGPHGSDCRRRHDRQQLAVSLLEYLRQFGVSFWVQCKCLLKNNLPIDNITVNVSNLLQYIFSIIGSTMPVPCGMFIPMMKIGSSYGRLFGEGMHYFFPGGFGKLAIPIQPGGYAVVGSAAFSAGVTHSVSVGVILFEITGQIRHIIPVMIAVLIANYVASFLQLSMYDSYIMIKKLPFLPALLPSCPSEY